LSSQPTIDLNLTTDSEGRPQAQLQQALRLLGRLTSTFGASALSGGDDQRSLRVV